MIGRVLAAVAVALTGLTTIGAASAGAAPGPGVYLLGDSVFAGATDALEHTLRPAYPDMVLNAAVCRGLVASCSYAGRPAPTTGLAEIDANAGRLGDVVVIELGYNDKPSATAIDTALSALTAQDVPLVLWVGLSTLNRPDFAPLNDRLRAATARWPTLRFLDWDAVSHGHPDWFIPDDGVGVHLTANGVGPFASWLKDQLDGIPGIGVPPPPGQHCDAAVAVGAPSPGPTALPASPPEGPSPDPPNPSAGFTGVAPRRLLDSRGGRPLGASRVIELQVTGRSGVPARATAAALNVTAVDPCDAGFLTVYPCGSPAPPLASTVNFARGETRPNLVVARLGPGGRACIYSMVQTDVVVDATGWFGPDVGDDLVAADPRRLLDTRLVGAIAAGTAIGLTVTGGSGAPAGIDGVVLNVTGVGARAPGYLTVWPAAPDGSCDATTRPGTSNVNMAGADPVANLVTISVGPTGRVCIFSFATAHAVVDLDGWFAPVPGRLRPQTPRRVLDTRANASDVSPDTPIVLDLGAGVTGAVLNVTAVQPRAAGYVTVWPAPADGACRADGRPVASNLNYGPGAVVANLVVAGATNGRVCIYSFARTHLVADLDGVS